MAEARSGPGPNLAAWPVIAVWLVAAVGSFTARPRLETARPEGATFPERPAQGAETVPARLWQDPIQAAYQAYEAASAEDDPPASGCLWQDLLSTAYRACRADKADKRCRTVPSLLSKKSVLILPVFVPGTAYGAEVERRVRSRYAVVAALNVAGYLPERRQHIGYFTLPGPGNGATGSAAVRIIPYEWFKRIPLDAAAVCLEPPVVEKPSEKVLVLWIDEQQVADQPLAHLVDVVDSLARSWGKRDELGSKDGAAAVNVLGPMSSDTLVTMLSEERPKASPEAANALDNAVVYSSWATIPDKLLPTSRPWLKRQADKDSGPLLRRIGTSDERLCALLVKELALRNALAGGLQNHIALVSEWDTTYGRALPATFDEKLGDYIDRVGYWAEHPPLGKKECRPKTHRYSYLRGIDGRVPRQQGTTSQDRPPETEEEITSERPVGQSQLDYLQRLEQHLKQLDRRVRCPEQGENRNGKDTNDNDGARRDKDGKADEGKNADKNGEQRGRLAAIGILGTDNYDKLLILRALRPSFPGVVFFTTDLDACLLHPTELEWTRNLVIASHFGLRLHCDLQRDIPPFRNSYQTALFYAALKALGVKHLDDAKLEPRVYEVGAHGAYDLSVNKKKESGPLPASPRADPLERWKVLPFALIVLALLLPPGSASRSESLRERFRQTRAARIGALLLVIVGFIALFAVAAADHQNPDGEPFVLFEGISAWPTDFLRLFAGVLAVWFCIATRWRVTADTEDLGKEFFKQKAGTSGDQPSSPPPQQDGKWLGRLLGRLRRLFEDAWQAGQRLIIICWKIPGPVGSPKPTSSLWEEYKQRRSWGRCFLRVAGVLIFYVIATILLFRLVSYPVSPVRGWVSQRVDIVGILLGYIGVVTLLFLVLDTTRLCDRFIRLLFCEDHSALWADDVRTPALREFDLRGEDVDDWLSIKLIARHTEVVDKIIYYPFFALLILLVARHPVFDNWTWSIPLITMFSFLLLAAVWAAFLLRRSASRARRTALARVSERISQARQASDPRRAGGLEKIMNEIKSVQTGAFSRFRDNPVFAAILIPSGGMGALAVIDLLVRHL